ncbi:MAG: hypothetical protein ACLQIQ_03595 [Beijerinckiaceae bacterium]
MKTKQFRTALRRHPLVAGLMAFVLCGALGGQAFAAECSVDLGNLSKKRQAIIDELNKLSKASPKGQLDPTVSCPRLQALSAAEQELLAYMNKNKGWCMIPDEVVTNFAEASGRSKSVAIKACAVAEQIKKGIAAGNQNGPKLPTGPL